jgi:hypothetical protein
MEDAKTRKANVNYRPVRRRSEYKEGTPEKRKREIVVNTLPALN